MITIIISEKLSSLLKYVKGFIKWTVIALIVGGLGGVLGSFFHECIDYVTHLRTDKPWLLYMLPFGGLVIVFIYRLFKNRGSMDTNSVIKAVRENTKLPIIMAPLIFVGTVITHLFGGSAGREGAALQLGGSIGYNIGKLLRFGRDDLHIIVMTGMSSVFSSMFGTPLTAAIFSLELISVGVIHYAALVPCLMASLTAYKIALWFGISPVRFEGIIFGSFSTSLFARVIVLSLLVAALSVVFCVVSNKTEHLMKKLLPNGYLRAFVGGTIIVLVSLALGTYDYNGAGMDIVARAMSGDAAPETFILKLLFTAVTISAGFKGGEIVPAFFVGSTFGCTIAPLIGLDASLGAAIGFSALFCGVVNCPIASILLALEVFGADGILFFALACAVSYMMSGCYGIYKGQKIVYSKISEEYIDINAK